MLASITGEVERATRYEKSKLSKTDGRKKNALFGTFAVEADLFTFFPLLGREGWVAEMKIIIRCMKSAPLCVT